MINKQKIANALAPFKQAMGTHFEKFVADTQAMVGRWEKDAVLEDRELKSSAKCKLKFGTDGELQMPLNNLSSIMLRFGCKLQEINRQGYFGGTYVKGEETINLEGIQAEIPVTVQAAYEKWVQHGVNKTEETPA